MNWMICGQATRHCICSQDNQFPDNGRIDFNLLEVRTNTNTLQVNTICITNDWFIARYGEKMYSVKLCSQITYELQA